MTILDTVNEVQAFLESETTVTLMQDEPSKFLSELATLLDDISTAADDVDSATEDTVSEAENAISELEYVQ